MNPHIFREYDIRGIADCDLDNELVQNLGRAFGTYLNQKGAKKIVISRDIRLSSDRLHQSLKKGLLETGLNLVDIGICPTPMMYFAVFYLDLDGGVQITGSHNPPPENGFKLMSGKQTLFGNEIRELRSIIENKDYILAEEGLFETYDLLPAYIGYMRGNIQLVRTDLRIALDAGNGCAGPAAMGAMQALGLNPDGLFCEMDGSFPNHHPDPSMPENLSHLIDYVREKKLEVGFAYDGDADRIGVIDANGEIIWGDKLMILFSRQILKTHPGASIIGEVKCSQTLYDDVSEKGGNPIIWKTGHSLIKDKMKKEGALLAGEMSGHIFFADKYYGFDDAIYASLRVLEILSLSQAPLHELLADLPQTYSTPEIRVKCDDQIKFDIVTEVLNHYRQTHKVLDVDGARVEFENGWGLVRASNTQPVLVLRFEAQSKEELDRIKADVEDVVRRTEERYES